MLFGTHNISKIFLNIQTEYGKYYQNNVDPIEHCYESE